ncbi:MAG TPA: diguanylate cyclase [Syntrophorhabdales bacterium]|nr:diguanylate cyclase [Syntrophorhabdales bacterium]
MNDDTVLNRILKEFFREYGIKVFAFSDEIDFDGEIREKKPHAVLLDVGFSSASPTDLIHKIRKSEAHMPVIVMAGMEDYTLALECLRAGAYAVLKKPFSSYEEIYHGVNNAMSHFMERLEIRELTAEMEKRFEHDKLNLLELEFVKSLQRMIGETEDAVTVLKHSFTLIRNFLSFELFAALVPQQDEIEIHVYPNSPGNPAAAESVPSTLIRRMRKALLEEKKIKVIFESNGGGAEPEGDQDYRSVIVALATRDRTYGCAGIYRSRPFDYYEESIFKRFCAHISSTLEKIELFKEVRALSVNDGLTSLYTHFFITSKLSEEVMRSERYGSNLSIMLFDLDNFKEINDTHGHLAGDAVLKEVGRILKESLRSLDSVGRYGGEEFLVLLPETDGDSAKVIGERLRKKIEETEFMYEQNHMRLTICGGLAVHREGMDENALIKIADENLYKAKREGKNMVCYETK